jgi:hypothetical protein
MIYEVGMILRSKEHGGRLTILECITKPFMRPFLTFSTLYTLNCLNHDNKLISKYSPIELDMYWEITGEYDKTVKILYGAK